MQGDGAKRALAIRELPAVHRLGCGVLDYREQAQQIELKTGGMTVAPYVLPDDSHLDTYEQVMFVSPSQGIRRLVSLVSVFFLLNNFSFLI